MSEEREISLESVTGNALDKLDSMNPEDPGYQQQTKAVETLLKYRNEPDKVDLGYAEIEAKKKIAEAENEIAKERLKLDREIFEADVKQKEAENELRKEEIKASKLDTVLKSTVIAVCIGEFSYHYGMKAVAKFEESGVWRSLTSKLWTNRLGKKK